MATLTESEQNTIILYLGYSSIANTLTNELAGDETPEHIAQVQSILANLALIDQQLTDARTDSMAMAVGNLRLSYSQHVGHLKGEGSRLLFELANVTGIRVLYNKYVPRSSKSMVSYW